MDFPKKTTVQSVTIPIQPRYVETDQAGVVHHSVYPIWFEMGRTELLRSNGLAYKKLEAAGVYFVVARLEIKYHRPAKYDDQLKLTTSCAKVTTCRVDHCYKLYRPQDDMLLTEGTSTLACVDNAGKIRKVPDFMYPGS